MRDGYFIIDTHHHVGSLAAFGDVGLMGPGEGMSPEEMARAEVESRLATMDQTGVDQAIILPGHLYFRPAGVLDTKEINDGLARYRDAHPDRFPAAVGVVEPLYGDVSLEELERIKTELGLVGVSFHVRFQGVSTNSPLVVRLVRRMAELGLVPLVHAVPEVSDESVWRLYELASAVPEATMIVLDAFASHETSQQVMSVAKAAPNLVFDSSLSYNAHMIERIAKELGPDRVVFGTDVYSNFRSQTHNATLEHLLAMNLDKEAMTAILGGNIQRILLGKTDSPPEEITDSPWGNITSWLEK